jgi:hypothetical protein
MSTISFKEDTDKILYESEKFYICERNKKTRFFYKTKSEVDNVIFEGLIELENKIYQVGIIQIIEELLKEHGCFPQREE